MKRKREKFKHILIGKRGVGKTYSDDDFLKEIKKKRMLMILIS
jgi:ATP-dependent Clp protease ATP-binding subunit ClpA